MATMAKYQVCTKDHGQEQNETRRLKSYFMT